MTEPVRTWRWAPGEEPVTASLVHLVSTGLDRQEIVDRRLSLLSTSRWGPPSGCSPWRCCSTTPTGSTTRRPPSPPSSPPGCPGPGGRWSGPPAGTWSRSSSSAPRPADLQLARARRRPGDDPAAAGAAPRRRARHGETLPGAAGGGGSCGPRARAPPTCDRSAGSPPGWSSRCGRRRRPTTCERVRHRSVDARRVPASTEVQAQGAGARGPVRRTRSLRGDARRRRAPRRGDEHRARAVHGPPAGRWGRVNSLLHSWLPEGRLLPDEVFARRHARIVQLCLLQGLTLALVIATSARGC